MLAVVVAHAIIHSAPPDEPWVVALYAALRRGELGVPLFFVISGFCIHLRWAGQYATSGRVDLGFFAFWRRRVFRLYPPYAVALAGSMALVAGAWFTGTAPFLVAPYPEPKAQWITLDFLAHVTMLYGFLPIFDRAAGNPPLWTLAREEYLYLMYFIVLAWRQRLGAPASTGVVLLLSLGCSGVVVPLLSAQPIAQTIARDSAAAFWIQWCLGMLAAEAYCGLLRLPAWCRSGRLVVGWAALAFAAEAYAPPFAITLWGMTFFTLVNRVVAAETGGRWPQRPAVDWLTRLGVVSYSIYLVHMPVQMLTESAVRRLFATAGVIDGPWAYLMRAALLVVAACAAGKAFFALVERHFLRGPLRHRPSVATPGRPAARGAA